MTKQEIATLYHMVAVRHASAVDCAEARRCAETMEQLHIAAACRGQTRVHYVKAALHSFRFGR